MFDGLTINYVKNGRQCIEKPSFNAGGAAFFEGRGGGEPHEIEARMWINSILEDTPVYTKPEEALIVTQILEAIYTSAKTGDPVYIRNEVLDQNKD